MQLQEIINLTTTSAQQQELNDPLLFSDDIKLVLKTYSHRTLESLSDDFWKKEIPTIVAIKRILEINDVELKKDLPLGPIEYLKSVIIEEIHKKALQILEN